MRRYCERVVTPDGVAPEDRWAQDLFEANCEKYCLDRGGLDERFRNAERMTKELFSGTKYYVFCETYCVGCTVTVLYKRNA